MNSTGGLYSNRYKSLDRISSHMGVAFKPEKVLCVKSKPNSKPNDDQYLKP